MSDRISNAYAREHPVFDRESYTAFLARILQPRTFTADGVTVPYRLWVPEHYTPDKKYPLGFYLHGSGICGTDNLRQLSDDHEAKRMLLAAQEGEEFFFFLPQCPSKPWSDYTAEDKREGIAPFRAEHPHNRAVVGIIRALCTAFSIDTARIFGLGVSMGGMGLYDLCERYPTLLSAAVIGCGMGDPQMAEALARTPLWIWHGDADTVVPVSGARKIVPAVRAAGGEVRYTEMPGAGHAFAPPELWQPMMEWALSKRRLDR